MAVPWNSVVNPQFPKTLRIEACVEFPNAWNEFRVSKQGNKEIFSNWLLTKVEASYLLLYSLDKNPNSVHHYKCNRTSHKFSPMFLTITLRIIIFTVCISQKSKETAWDLLSRGKSKLIFRYFVNQIWFVERLVYLTLSQPLKLINIATRSNFSHHPLWAIDYRNFFWPWLLSVLLSIYHHLLVIRCILYISCRLWADCICVH